MQVYLPASLPTARLWARSREIGPPPLTGYAVTPGLRSWYTEADEDELEYAALSRAAHASLRLLAGAPPRRVVVAVDVDAAEIRDDLDEGAVRLLAAVPFRVVTAGFVDDPDAEAVVAQAVSVIDAADLGDPDAEFTVSATEDHEFGWYAAQELADL